MKFVRYGNSLLIVSEEKTTENASRVEKIVRLFDESDLALKRLEAGKSAC